MTSVPGCLVLSFYLHVATLKYYVSTIFLAGSRDGFLELLLALCHIQDAGTLSQGGGWHMQCASESLNQEVHLGRPLLGDSNFDYMTFCG